MVNSRLDRKTDDSRTCKRAADTRTKPSELCLILSEIVAKKQLVTEWQQTPELEPKTERKRVFVGASL